WVNHGLMEKGSTRASDNGNVVASSWCNTWFLEQGMSGTWHEDGTSRDGAGGFGHNQCDVDR
ncbi:hypothetical protein P7K49_001039, partial [Saguinus oedipus]